MKYKAKDYIHQLAEHIKKNLSKGYTVDALRFSLMNQGYSRISIDKAIELVNKQLASEVPLIKEKPQITYRIIEDKSQFIQISKEKKSFWRRLFGN